MPDANTEQSPAFEPITTQEAADAYVAAHLPEDYATLTARVPELEAELAASKRELLAAQVAAETGVPAAALTGATREEIEASAKALLEWRGASMPKPTPKPPNQPVRKVGLKSGAAGNGEPLSAKAAAADALRRMHRGA